MPFSVKSFYGVDKLTHVNPVVLRRNLIKLTDMYYNENKQCKDMENVYGHMRAIVATLGPKFV